MKNKTWYLLIIALLFSATTQAQTAWLTKKLDDRLSVKFPAEPQKTTSNAMDVYNVMENDGVGYSVSVMDFYAKAHIDSATLSSFKDNQQFADQVRMTMVSGMPNYKFGDVTIGKWKAYTAYTISGSGNTKQDKVSIFIILIGSKMYGFMCLLPPNVATKNKDIFLDSIELVKE